YHLYFKTREKNPTTHHGFMDLPLDIMGEKTNVVCPPSIINGSPYSIEKTYDIMEVDSLVDWVENSIKKRFDFVVETEYDVDLRLVAGKILEQEPISYTRYDQYQCIFHPEENPSLTVYPDGFHCFGCGKSGGVLELMKGMGWNEDKTSSFLEKEGIKTKKPVVLDMSFLNKRERKLNELAMYLMKHHGFFVDENSGMVYRYNRKRNSNIMFSSNREIQNYLMNNLGTSLLNRDIIHLKEFIYSTSKPSKKLVSFRNMVVDMEGKKVFPATEKLVKEKHITKSFNYNYNPNARGGLVEKTMREIFIDESSDDEAKLKVFLSLVGYCFTNHNQHNKIFYFVGPGGNGKSTAIGLLTHIFNTASLDLQRMGTGFSLQALLGKDINICQDVSRKKIEAYHILKGISGEDPITVERKYESPVTVVFPTKIIVVGNVLPKTPEDTIASHRRTILIELKNTFLGKKAIPGLKEKMLKDKEGMEWLIYQGIQEYWNVVEDGEWKLPLAPDDVRIIHQLYSDPVGFTLRLVYEDDIEDEVEFLPRKEVMAVVSGVMEEFGLEIPKSTKDIYRELRDIFDVQDVRKRINGVLQRGFVGIKENPNLDLDIEKIKERIGRYENIKKQEKNDPSENQEGS
ncbi:MAG: DUF5906 domain-containing protein, partial [Candidatus Thermoplasmatota archaeon]|nr:DUF5906 domain-containing protein [Candidatus Thermoplasmatota archaeon]